LIEISDVLILLAAGGVGGFLAGLLGIGGGIIYVVILAQIIGNFGIPIQNQVPFIIANSMFAIFFAGLSGSIKQYANNNFYPKEILISAIPASLTCIAVSYLITLGSWYSKSTFNIIFVVLMSLLAIKILIYRAVDSDEKKEDPSRKKFALVGASGGLLAGLSGVGGGVVMVPFLTNFMNIRIKKATGVSLGVIVVMSFLTSIYNLILMSPPAEIQLQYSVGYILFPVVIPLSIGSLLFSPLGVIASRRIRSDYIRLLFVSFIAIVVTRMVYSLI
jgi:uncharacterized membrane protein YfcA